MDEEYCGNYPSTSTPTAGIDAAFDSDAHINSDDMSAQDISDFIDALDVSGGAYQWKLAGTATGNVNTVTVPNNAQEVIAIIEATSGVIYSDIALVSNLRAIWNVGGYYLSTSDIGLCNLNVSNGNKTFQIRNCRYGISDYKTTATLSVYYKSFEVPQEVADYVVEQATNSNGTYRKWNSGVLEQWGTEASASASNHSVSLPTPFAANTEYLILGTNTSGTQSNFMTSNSSASSFMVYVTASTRLFWHAIGRWK